MATVLKIDLKALNKEADRIAKDISTTIHNVSTCVVKFALLIDREAKELISSNHGTGKISGRGVQRANKRRGTGRRTLLHQASAPGEPPVTDTGRLVASIRPAFYGEFSAEVGSLQNIAKYGGMLEDGTKKMSSRPWLKPTLDKNSSALESFLSAAIKTGGLV